jgi:HK97 family phage portal protein
VKILGFHVPFTKATDENAVTPIRDPFQIQSRWGIITEAFGGMWQSHLRIDNTQSLLGFSAVFACISLISGDVAKLRITLQRRREDGVWEEFESPAFSPVLRKPNRYQTRLQFIEQWLISKLIWGNSYILKERDNRGVVVALYVLDASRVTPLLAPDREVLYRLNPDTLAGVDTQIAVPASEIIHDRGKVLFHPLVGVAPLYACALSTTQGRRIQTNAAKFFENMSRPSGILTAPDLISDETAKRLKADFEASFSGDNIGRLLVAGNGLTYQAMTMPAQQAQLIEQLGWTTEDVARAFLVPLYKISGQKDVKVDPATRQEYYQTTLQLYIEAIEGLLHEGLGLDPSKAIEFDTDEGLLRMDTAARYDAKNKAVGGGWLAPNEARRTEGLVPVPGGDSPMMQQQQWSLAQLANRRGPDDAADADVPAAPPGTPSEEEAEKEMRALLKHIQEGLSCGI